MTGTRTRTRIAAIALAAILPATVAACGSGSSNPDPHQVLHETFNNPKSVSSGTLDVNLGVNVQGSQSGSFTATISGPFQSQTGQGLPQFNLTGKLGGTAPGIPSISFTGGLEFTKDNAYVSYQGTAYRLPPQWFAQLRSLASRTAQSSNSGQSISSVFSGLGIRPETWFRTLTSEGTTDVDGVSTDHISGDVDVRKVALDLRKLSRLSQQIPGQTQKLTPAQLAKLEQGVRNAHVDIYSGTSDHLLRKLSVSLDLAPPQGGSSSSVTALGIDFSVTLSDLNQPQTISTPKNTRPLPRSFLRQVLALGALGSTGIGGGSSGTGAGGSSSATGNAGALEQRYRQCVQSSGGTAGAINRCLQQLYG